MAAEPAKPPFVMKISSPMSGDVQNEWMRRFKAGLDKRSGGRIRVELYPANQLGQLATTVEGVAMGTIEVTIPAVGFLVGLEPRFQVLDAPGLFDSVEHGQRVLNDAEIRNRLSAFGKAKGIEPLFVYVASPMYLLAHRPVKSPEDLRGQKIRATGGTALYTAPLKRFGASPVTMSLGEVLSAMQNRTIDGMTAGIAPYVTFKYYDVARDLTRLPGAFLVSAAIVNRKFMESLGPELERMVREEARKAEEVFAEENLRALDVARQSWAAHGGRIHEFAPAKQQQYLSEVKSIIEPIVSKDSAHRDDFRFISSAAEKYRNPTR